MGVDVDWGIAERGIERTRQQFDQNMGNVTSMIKQHSVRRAAEDYQADPKNAKAISYLYSVNPTLAASLEKATEARAEEALKGEARSAQSAWLLSQTSPRGNALAGAGPVGVSQANSPGQPANALNAGQNAFAGLGASPTQAAVPSANAMTSPNALARVDPLAPLAPVDAVPVSAMPQASPAADPAWERYVRADPSGAMRSMLEKQHLTKAQNEAMFAQMDMLGRLARSAVDQPTYEAAIQRAQGLGIDTSSLPRQFDPAAVNAAELQAMSAKEYLTEQRNDRKLEWDVKDDQIDNTRADRNVDSQVAARQGQLSNVRRGQDLADSRGRRGQDLANDRGRRGQDLTDSRGRRGQDMGGRKPARGSSGGDGAVIVNPKTGQRMKLQGGKWVPAA